MHPANGNQDSDSSAAPDDQAPMVLPARPRWKWGVVSASVAWLIVVAIIVFNLFFSRPTALEPKPGEAKRSDFALDLQARYLVGVGQLPGSASSGSLLAQAKELDRGKPSQRPKGAIVVGELGGAEAALESSEPSQRRSKRFLFACTAITATRNGTHRTYPWPSAIHSNGNLAGMANSR